MSFRVRGLALREEPADQRFAAAQAVDVGGVEEGDAGVGGGAERVERLLVGDVAPVGAAELPAAQADLRDPRLEPAEWSFSHVINIVGARSLAGRSTPTVRKRPASGAAKRRIEKRT